MLTPLFYTLKPGIESNLNSAQDKAFKSISKDYPFQNLCDETDDHFVARTYLQFLWLPESIMPLNLLVPSLLRITAAQESTPHPLHLLLEPLLLTTNSASNKYRVELPQILSDGEGAGEMEETMMWYVINYEKHHDAASPNDAARSSGTLEDPWVKEEWRKDWLQRMERREVQVQILLYLLKLSLPGLLHPFSKSKKKRKGGRGLASTDNMESQLESFMDKLSTWQLLSELEKHEQEDSLKKTRDWMQIFCEDIVEPEFKSKLPDKCSLLRSKVFPNSPFSDDDSQLSSRSASPSHYETPTVTTTRTSSLSSQNGHPPRPRSRSLSLSLAQEAETRRAGSVGANSKRVLNREVSMSRVFKAKGTKEKEKPMVRHSDSKATVNKRDTASEEGVTLVEATPVKIKGNSSAIHKKQRPGLGPSHSSQVISDHEQDEGEEVWYLPGSPDILLLGETGNMSGEQVDIRKMAGI